MEEERKDMSIKLVIDKKMNRVVFAECGNDFVDVLLSFLTIPIGTLIRLCKKNSNLGCMDTLYKSVEALDHDCFQTEACKEMLLKPKSASEFICQNLAVNVDGGVVPKPYYLCPNWICSSQGYGLASMFKNVSCLCGRKMTQRTDFVEDKGEGVFVKGYHKFMVFDNLTVALVSRDTSLVLGDLLGTEEATDFEERTIAVGLKEVLKLLKRSLFSTKPLTDVFLLNKRETTQMRKLELWNTSTQSSKVQENNKKIKVTLWKSKSKNKVLFAEVNEDFLNLLFSFLAFPLGLVVKFLARSSPIGSMNNLYRSVEELCTEHPENVTEDMDHLLDPQIAHHFGWKNQLIKSEEASWSFKHLKCIDCFNMGENYCSHGIGHTELHLINPKSPNLVTTQGGGFVDKCMLFMVFDDLVVAPLSWRLFLSTIEDWSVPHMDIEQCVTYLGEEEAHLILEASFISRTTLSDVFCRSDGADFVYCEPGLST